MATWKKIAISGSDISQFNNDSNYLINEQDGAILTGSFSGSFTGVVNIDLEDLTAGAGLLGDNYDGNIARTFSVDSGSLAGNGLGTSAGAFIVNVDDSSIEINSDALRIKADGVTNAMLVNDSIQLGTTDIVLGTTGSSIAGLTLTGVSASGSFSGSFEGDGSGLTGVQASSLANSLTDGNGIANFTFDGSSPATVAVQSDVTTGGNTKPVAVSANGVGFDISTIDGTGLTTNAGELELQLEDIIATDGVNRVLTSDGDGTLTAEPNFTFDGTTLTVTGNEVVTGDLTVLGTASFQNTTNLEIADRFILLASGSNTSGDGGLVVQQSTQNVGEIFGFDSGTTRWAVTSSFDASTSAFTPDAYMAAAIEGTGIDPEGAGAPDARYSAKGNIYVGTDESIWIYS